MPAGSPFMGIYLPTSVTVPFVTESVGGFVSLFFLSTSTQPASQHSLSRKWLKTVRNTTVSPTPQKNPGERCLQKLWMGQSHLNPNTLLNLETQWSLSGPAASDAEKECAHKCVNSASIVPGRAEGCLGNWHVTYSINSTDRYGSSPEPSDICRALAKGVYHSASIPAIPPT